MQEFEATAQYAQTNPDNLCWHATIGDGIVAIHLAAEAWGWSARAFSSDYLAVEFAQPNLGDPISDAAVAAFAWWWLNIARVRWPELPRLFVNHSEVDRLLQTPDGKTDLWPAQSRQAADFRQRILARVGV